MFQILFDHFIRDSARRPRAASDCPKMIAPISLFQIWKLRLKQPRGVTFQMFYQIRARQARRIFNVHVKIVTADRSGFAHLPSRKSASANHGNAPLSRLPKRDSGILLPKQDGPSMASLCDVRACFLSSSTIFTQILAEAN